MSGFDTDLRGRLVASSANLSGLKTTGRFRLRGRFLAGGSVVVVASGAVAVASASMDPEVLARNAAADAAIALLAQSPEIGVAALPSDEREVLESNARLQRAQIQTPGWLLGEGADTSVSVFRLTNGQFCFSGAREASCTTRDHISPNVAFGYDQARRSTKLRVIAPAGVTDFQAHTGDGKTVSIALAAGATSAEVSGKVVRVSWASAGIQVADDIAVEMSANP